MRAAPWAGPLADCWATGLRLARPRFAPYTPAPLYVAACLPRPAERLQPLSVDQAVSGHARVVSDAVTAPYGREVLARLSAPGRRLLLIDQTKVSERHQVVMVAVRLGGRALPLAWRVKETQARSALPSSARRSSGGTSSPGGHQAGADGYRFAAAPT